MTVFCVHSVLKHQQEQLDLPEARMSRARICKPFKEPRNQFPAWRVGTTTLFVVPARYIGWRNLFHRFLGSLNVYKYGLCSRPEQAVPSVKEGDMEPWTAHHNTNLAQLGHSPPAIQAGLLVGSSL
jgi:hypothetical protein